MSEPAKKSSGWGTVAKLLLILLAVGAALAVLVFGTCLFLFTR
jgi:hypothetical protein